MKHEANGQKDHLPTGEVLEPLSVLEQFGPDPTVIILITIWVRDDQTGLLEEKGAWVEDVRRRVLSRLADAQGCRLLWNTIFFAVPGTDVSSVKEDFRQILRTLLHPALESLCILAAADGSPKDKLYILDSMQAETATPRNFGTDKRFRHRLKDAEDWWIE